MPRKAGAMSSLLNWIVPDQFEALVGELTDFIASPGSAAGDLRDDLTVLLDRFGDGVKPARYEFLCDEAGKSRSAASKALRRSVEAGVALIVPMLVRDFKLDAVAAAGVATLVVKALATRGQGRLCEELSNSTRPKPKKPRRKPAPKRPARKKPAARKRRPARKRR
jgi:hypothetical protein